MEKELSRAYKEAEKDYCIEHRVYVILYSLIFIFDFAMIVTIWKHLV